ncbi:hypothetical protein KKB55_14635 [Myxococcota bacterium]|nr:hypothetical protein [Myxococcota bacterium]MBU1898973.1 hypothetical protein [Myxococcota bacterium]
MNRSTPPRLALLPFLLLLACDDSSGAVDPDEGAPLLRDAVVIAPLDAARLKDAAPIEPDSAPIEPDSAPIELDSAPIELDSAPIELDSAPIELDSAPIELDSAPIELDSAPVELDSAPVEPDAAPVDWPRPEIQGQCATHDDCLGGAECRDQVPGGLCVTCDCPARHACFFGVCNRLCLDDEGCPHGLVCLYTEGEGHCGMIRCEAEADCPSPYTCEARFCVRPACAVGCPAGMRCVGTRCVEPNR